VPTPEPTPAPTPQPTPAPAPKPAAPSQEPPRTGRATTIVAYRLTRRPDEPFLDLLDVPAGCVARFGDTSARRTVAQLRCRDGAALIERTGEAVEATCRAADCARCATLLGQVLRLPKQARRVGAPSCTGAVP
jgi:hypothetical protein